MRLEDYEFLNTSAWEKVFRFEDGRPLRGNAYAYLTDGIALTPEVNSYPTGLAVDAVFDVLTAVAEGETDLVGRRSLDWVNLTASPYLYPRGTGVSWHDDASKCSGAYIFYCHPVWDATWGGELLIEWLEDNPRRGDGLRDPGMSTLYGLDNSAINFELMETALGYYVLPKPNRLVLLQAGIKHKIKKVDDAAGENVRSSIAGFFMR